MVSDIPLTEFDADSRDVLRLRYETAASKALLDVQGAAVWRSILDELREINDAYLKSEGQPVRALNVSASQ